METAATYKPIPGVHVVLIDFGGSAVTHDELVAAAAALTIQAQQHFGLPPPYGYGVGASVRAGAGPFDVQPHEWVIGLFSKPDVAGALGYHDQTPHGQPLAKVFPLLDAADGSRWTVTASHELLELLADPNIARCAQARDGKMWAYEVCDACEALSYTINGVYVSDFVLPPYFEPVSSMSGLKFDWMGHIKAPLEILPGGYGQWFDPARGWVQVTNFSKLPRAFRLSTTGRGAHRRSRHA